MQKRSSYVDLIHNIRHKPPVVLVYEDGHEEPFYGSLHDLVDRLDMRMEMKGTFYTVGGARAYTSEPVFVIRPFVSIGGRPAVGTVKVFAKTSKMRAPSFSLPAGPPEMGGTCRAAGKDDLVEDDDLFICHGCYALLGNYGYTSTQLAQAVRRMAVIRMLAEGNFVEAMVAALRQYQSMLRWDAIKERVDGKLRTVGHVYLDTEFVRLHDSGDVLWLDGYLNAWVEIARQSPESLFWMPDRDWAMGSGATRKIQRALSNAPDNFVLRPSTLHVGDPAPMVEGLAAGTSVTFPPLEGNADFNCPAYDQQLEKTCQTAQAPDFSDWDHGCRVCWTDPAVSVNYEPHGARMQMQKLKSAVARRKATKTNPPMELTEAYQMYRTAPRSNPPAEDGFAAWLARRDIAGFTEDAWWDLLLGLGLDGDEVVEYLENSAEWQP